MDALSSIVNSKKTNNNYSLSSIDNSKRVDLLLLDCQDVICPTYKPFFAKRFYRLSDDTVRRCAATVRETAAHKPTTNPQSLFTWLIKREAGF